MRRSLDVYKRQVQFDVSGTEDAVDFTGVTQLKQVNIAGLEIEEAHGGLSMQDNIVVLKNYKVTMAQGESVLNGSINLQGEEPVFDLDVETAGVDVYKRQILFLMIKQK